LLTTISSWSSKSQMMNTQILLESKANNIVENFHEDFDSTYYYHGCQAFTFKLNHKCNGNGAN
jgi:hypothetical protein